MAQAPTDNNAGSMTRSPELGGRSQSSKALPAAPVSTALPNLDMLEKAGFTTERQKIAQANYLEKGAEGIAAFVKKHPELYGPDGKIRNDNTGSGARLPKVAHHGPHHSLLASRVAMPQIKTKQIKKKTAQKTATASSARIKKAPTLTA